MANNVDRNPGSTHLQRIGFTPGFYLKYPEEISLGFSSDVIQDELPSQIIEVYTRFYHLGWIDDYGSQCILMSSLLRRILRLHGLNAYQRQYVMYWEREEKGQKATIGGFNKYIPEGNIDAHVAVSVDNYIVDFALTPIYDEWGATAPRALIGADDSKYHADWQDFGSHGKASWVPARPVHPIIRHWRYEQKQFELDLSKEYFRKYQF
jgi:hypothetical protein